MMYASMRPFSEAAKTLKGECQVSHCPESMSNQHVVSAPVNSSRRDILNRLDILVLSLQRQNKVKRHDIIVLTS